MRFSNAMKLGVSDSQPNWTKKLKYKFKVNCALEGHRNFLKRHHLWSFLTSLGQCCKSFYTRNSK